MSGSIVIPKRIEDTIGKGGWMALSWALHNQWVSSYKWLFSEIAGVDIGTPHTVDLMLLLGGLKPSSGRFVTIPQELRNKTRSFDTRDLFMFYNRVLTEQADNFYQLLTEGYLLGTDFVTEIKPVHDDMGRNQLEGELRRFYRNPSLQLTKEIVFAFCQTYQLPNAFKPFCENLGIQT